MRDDKIPESNFIATGIANRGKQFAHQLMEMLFTNGIEIVFSVTTGFDQTRRSQQSQVVADRRLALVQPFAQRRNVQFTLAQQEHQDLESRFVGEQLEDLHQVAFELFR